MTTAAGPHAPRAHGKRSLKRKKPTTLAPLSPVARPNQRDDDAPAPTRLPLEVVFLNRYRRILRTHVNLCGWDPTDTDLRLLVGGRDGASARVDTLTLDDCTRVTVDGLRAAAPVLQALTTLRLARCTALSADAVGVLPVTLVEIDLAHCEWLDDHAVRALVCRCVALRRVSLAHCRRLTDYGIAAFADTPGVSLTELDVSRLPRVSDTGVLVLLMRCTHLQRLRACGLSSFEGLNLLGLPRNSAPSLAALDVSHNARMHFLTVVNLVRVLHAGTLTEVDVSHCAQLTDETLVALGRYAPSLRVLRVAFCTQLRDAGVTRLVEFVPLASDQLADFVEDDALRPRCTQLTTLELSGCFQVTSVGIASVARHCARLDTLLVDGLQRLDAAGLSAVAAHCSALHTLHWGGILIPSGVGGGGFFSVPTVDRAAVRAIHAMRALHTLRVGATKCDVDALAASLERLGPQLLELDASGIATDALCASVAAHAPRLRTLRLSRSRYFSEAAFLAVAASCAQLRALDLESCEQLHDRALGVLARHCPALERLVLSNDWQVTDAGVAQLAQRCPALVRLQLRHCPEVSPQCLRDVAARNAFVVATHDGLAPKPGAVAAFLRLDREMDAAARRLTRWLRDCLADRTHAKSAIDRALRHVRRRRRCAVRIQRSVRRWLAHRRQQQLIAQAQRACAVRVAARWRWVTAYCAGCRLLRRHLRAWLVRRHEIACRRAEAARASRERAASDVQRVYWGWRGRQRAATRRAEAAARETLRHASALRIERAWRGARGRRIAHAQATACVIRLRERVWRHTREWLAAVHVGRVVRGFLGRRRRHHRLALLEAERQRRHRGATMVQRCARAYLARVLFRRRLARGATAMQRVFRGFRGRRAACRVVLERAYARPPTLLLLCAGSVFTRELAVAWKAKRDAGELVASNLQRLYRGYFHGRLQRRLRRAAARQHAHRLDAAARCLQHFFRSIRILHHLARLESLLRRRRRGATTIQSAWRIWLGKVCATAAALRLQRRRRHEATLAALTSRVPQHAARLRLLQFGAIHVVATWYRQSLAARGWQTPSLVRFLHVCATRIQSLARGHQTRRRVARFRERVTWAARRVQRVWRGKLGRKQWRVMATERRRQLRLQEEADRAARIAHKLTGQFVLDANARLDRHARLLQAWVRTLQRRQVFLQARDVRAAALRAKAADRLGGVLTLATGSVVFQARVWRECMDRKQALADMEESDVRALESDVAALKRACLEQYVAHAAAAAQYGELARRRRDATTAKRRLRESTARMKQTLQPFAEQAKTLTLESARVHVENRQLQDELRRVRLGVAAFHAQLQTALPLEPLLYEGDVARLADLLGLPGGKPSMLETQVEAAVAAATGSS